MPVERTYRRTLDEGNARVRVEHWRDRRTVTAFVVQLEAWHDGAWRPVRRYDTAHGQPHLDRTDRHGRTYETQWLDLAPADALTLAIADIKRHWEQYVREFKER